MFKSLCKQNVCSFSAPTYPCAQMPIGPRSQKVSSHYRCRGKPHFVARTSTFSPPFFCASFFPFFFVALFTPPFPRQFSSPGSFWDLRSALSSTERQPAGAGFWGTVLDGVAPQEKENKEDPFLVLINIKNFARNPLQRAPLTP